MDLEVYCDGSGDAAVGRPGGWAFVVVANEVVVASGSGRAKKTTCLVMELEAAAHGLRAVVRLEPTSVELISDSSIVLDIAAGRFIPKPVKYSKLARSVRELAVETRAAVRWVRAHAGHRWNEYVDQLAGAAKRGEAGTAA